MNAPFWPPEDDAMLTQLWAQGLPSVAIGRALGRTKNAVVGRAHRLGLPGRASPIKGGYKPRPRKTVGDGTGSGTPAAKAAVRVAAPPQPAGGDAAPQAAPPRYERRPLAVWLVPAGHVHECQWPIGHPKQAGFRFCLAPAAPGRPYCAPHCRVAYIGFGTPRPESTWKRWP